MCDTKKSLTLPKLDWKKGVCEVCGESFDYITNRRPHTCKKGECKYKFEYKIKPETWVNHQFSLFDR